MLEELGAKTDATIMKIANWFFTFLNLVTDSLGKVLSSQLNVSVLLVCFL